MSDGDILPPYLKSWSEFRIVTRLSMARAWWRFRFGLSRLPIRFLRVLGQAPHGVVSVVIYLFNRYRDTHGLELMADIRSKTNEGTRGDIVKARQQHWDAMKYNVILDSLLLLAGAGAFWFYFVPNTPEHPVAAVLYWVGLVVAGAFILGLFGARKEDIIKEEWTGTGDVRPKLNSEMVMDGIHAMKGMGPAFKEGALDVPRIIQKPMAIKGGMECIVDLPLGKTYEDAISQQSNIAAGMRMPMGQVFVDSPGEDKPASWVRIIVTHTLLRDAPMPEWPLLKGQPIDVYNDPIPLGVDTTGNLIEAKMMGSRILIGGQPGSGKTEVVRNMVRGFLMDPTARAIVIDLKASVDFLDLEPWLERLVRMDGSATQEEQDWLMEVITGLADGEMKGRKATLEDIARSHPEKVPGGAVTRELASAGVGLHPLLIVVDETFVIFKSMKARKEFQAKVEELSNQARAFGMVLGLCTQRPSATTVPSDISEGATIRVCMAVEGHATPEYIGGTGSYAEGFRPDKLTPEDMGMGWVKGTGRLPLLMRGFLVSDEDGSTNGTKALDILRSIRGAGRVNKGSIPRSEGVNASRPAAADRGQPEGQPQGQSEGQSGGQSEDSRATKVPDFLIRMGNVWLGQERHDDGRMCLADLRYLMAQQHPHYGNMSAREFKAHAENFIVVHDQLKAHVLVDDAHGNKVLSEGKKNRPGIHYSDYLDAMTEALVDA